MEHQDDFPTDINCILGNDMIHKEMANMEKQLMATENALIEKELEGTNLLDAMKY